MINILFNAFEGITESPVLTSLLLLIDAKIYGFFSSLYSLYLTLANAEIFTSALYEDIANKIYLIIGVVALFILIYSFLQNIINPDNLKNNGKSGVKTLSKFVIAIIMITLTPTIFDFMYTAQDAILSDGIISKIFLGKSASSNIADEMYMVVHNEGEEPKYVFTEDCEYTEDYNLALQNCEKYKIKVDQQDLDNAFLQSYGNNMAFTVLNAFLYPVNDVELWHVNASDYIGTDETVKFAGIGAIAAIAVVVVVGVVAAVPTYGASLAGVVSALGTISTGSIIVAGLAGGAAGVGVSGLVYAVSYEEYTWPAAVAEIVAYGDFDRITPFAAAIASGNMDYIPIVSTICGIIMCYMLLSYCIDLGVRAAKLAFYQLFAPITFMLNILPGQKDLLKNWFQAVITTWMEIFVRLFTLCGVAYFLSNLNKSTFDSLGFLAKAVIVMGLITFAKQFPKLLGDLTGIKSENMKLGIMEKLGAGGVLAAGALIGGGLTAGVRNFTNSWRKNKGTGIRGFGNAFKSGLAGAISGGVRSAKSTGFKAKNWGDMKKGATLGAKQANLKASERRLYKATHGNNFAGVVSGRVSDAITGARNWAGLSSGILDIVSYEDEYINLFDDYAAIYSNAVYKATESHLSQISARILAEGEGALVSPGSTQTLKEAKKNLTEELTLMRLKAIRKSRESAAYVAYNIARQVIKDPALAARSGISSDFIAHADDFILRGNKIYHKSGKEWETEDLQKLFEATMTNISTDSSGKIISETFNDSGNIGKQYLYEKFAGLNATKGAVKGKRTEDKNSIDYKEAKKAKDSSKS